MLFTQTAYRLISTHNATANDSRSDSDALIVFKMGNNNKNHRRRYVPYSVSVSVAFSFPDLVFTC